MARNQSPQDPSSPIAIVGMACRFPKAPDLRTYWRNLRDGVDAVGPVPESHWKVDDYFDQDPKRPDHTYAKRGAFLEATPFYPLEFGISPRDIEATDTTQLFAMLAAREAMWDAGYAGPQAKAFDRSKTSVMLGVTGSLELVIPLGARLSHPHWRAALLDSGVEESVVQEVLERMSSGYVPWQENSFPGLLGNVAAGRIANRLDLHGTNCVVDAACASSLSALHLACLELQSGRADMALSGGVDTFNDIFMYMCFSKTPALSKSGDARPFSAQADGTILGEGVGVLVLKRLADAQRDNDHVYAVISGIGTSSDGKGHAVYAPSSEGQKRCLADAYAQSGWSPRQVELVEAHGTGTPVGDGIELQALVSTFNDAPSQPGAKSGSESDAWCAVGSVKSMIGHTKAAAGVAGLMKCVLALQSRVLPPTLKAAAPNEKLATPGPLYLNQVARPWLRADAKQPRRAGVSAFGFGGSNFHCLLQEAPREQLQEDCGVRVDPRFTLLAVSADTQKELLEALEGFGALQDTASLRSAVAKARLAFDVQAAVAVTAMLDLDQWSADPKASMVQLAATVLDSKARKAGVFVRSAKSTQDSPKLRFEFGALARKEPSSLFLWSDLAIDVAESWLATKTGAQRRSWWEQGKGDKLSSWMSAVAYAHVLRDWKLDLHDPKEGHRAHAGTKALSQFVRGELDLKKLKTALRKAPAPSSDEQVLSQNKEAGELELWLSGQGAALGGQPLASDALPSIEKEQRALVLLAAELLAAGVKLPLRGWDLQAEAGRLAAPGRGMAVSILGANAKPQPCDLPPRPRNSVRTQGSSSASDSKSGFDPRASLPNGPVLSPELVMSKAMSTDLPQSLGETPIQTAQDAFAATQAQIEALLTLQEQAAQLHQQFLASQEATLLRYQELIARQQSLVASQLGVAVPAMPQLAAPLGGQGASTAAPSVGSTPGAGHSALSGPFVSKTDGTLPAAVSSSPRAKPAISAAAAAFAGISSASTQATPDQEPVAASDEAVTASPSQALRATLYAVVADKTGYPRDILEPEMRLDEDLGIDSIKRVEVGSALSEKIDGLESMDAQDLHGLETLQAWEEALQAQLDRSKGATDKAAAAASSEAESESGGAPELAASTAQVGPAQLRRAILEVVSDKTGYPHASLEWEMRLDDDLGIDSIKRVEIFSTLQERADFGELPDADALAQLDTLEAVYEALMDRVQSEPAASVAEVAAPVGQDEPKVGAESGTKRADLMALLVKVVADKTGYPPEMIEPTMELDQELGIDSIKRVEIMAALSEQEPLAAGLDAEELAQMRDLDSLCSAILAHSGDGSQTAEKVANTETAEPKLAEPKLAEPKLAESKLAEPKLAQTAPSTPKAKDGLARAPQRFVTKVIPWDPEAEQDEPKLAELVPAGATLWLVCAPKEPVGMALEQALIDLGYRVSVVSEAQKAKSLPLPAGLIVVAPPWHVDTGYLGSLLEVLSAFGQARKLEEVSGGVLMGVTQINGSFGWGEFPVDADPLLGAVAGMIKTAAREWPDLRCMACDLEAGWTDADEIAVSLLEQLDLAGPVERGLGRDSSVRQLQLEAQPLSAVPKDDADLVTGVQFTDDDLALVSAGARGVTARAVLALAKQGVKNFVLLGRSKAMLDEPEWIQGIEGEARMKSMIASKSSQKLHPRRLEARYREITAGRQIRTQIEALEALGAKASYASADLRDNQALGKALELAKVDPAKVSILVHGAGVLADGRIEDKRPEDFEAVYGTKVEGLANLLAWCDASPLRAMVLFSSSTARFGRVGQVDYAAANEVLNKIAARQAQVRPHCRVAAINWGPWDGGMVTSSLKTQFASEGVYVLEADQAAEHLVSELMAPQAHVESVVLGEGSRIESVFVGHGQVAEPQARLLVESALQRSEPEIIIEDHHQTKVQEPQEEEAKPQVDAVATKVEQGPSFLQSLAAQHGGAKKPVLSPKNATPRQRNRATLSAAGKAVWKRSVSLKTDPYLSEHAFATRAVVPAAWMVEWMAQAAARLESSLHLVGVDDFQVLRGVRLTQDEVCDLRVVVGRIDNRGDQRILQMHIASGPDVPGQSTLHGRARVVLADNPQTRLDNLERFPTLRSDDLWDLHNDSIYDLGLFHEGSFRLLGEIRGNSKQPDLVLGSLRNDLAEDRWQGLGKVNDWLIHPEIMDAAFQMMIVWSLKTQGEASLPTSFGRYRQLADFDPSAVKLAVHVRRRAPRRATADIIWRDVKGRIVATMRDFSCVMDPALREAFGRREVEATPPPVDLPPKAVTP